MRLSAEAAHNSKYSQVQWNVLGHVQYWIEKGEWELRQRVNAVQGLGGSVCRMFMREEVTGTEEVIVVWY